jgi:P4 family phage/plasmid primase-like protien
VCNPGTKVQVKITDGFNEDRTVKPARVVMRETVANHQSAVNLAVRLGEHSRGLIDIDLDTSMMKRLFPHFADRFLPPGAPLFGRQGKPPGHALYRVARLADSGRTKQYGVTPAEAAEAGIDFTPGGEDKCKVMEVRSTGGYTVMPGSTIGTDPIVFSRWGTPPEIERAELEKRVLLCAALSLILGAYPRGSGNRNEICLALAGALFKVPWLNDADVDWIVGTIAELGGDTESRSGRAADTRAKVDAGEPAWGLTKLCELLGFDALKGKLALWMYGKREKGKGDASKSNGGRELARSIIAKRPAPLIFHQEEWAGYERGRYHTIEDTVVRSEIYTAAEAAGLEVGSKAVSSIADGLKTLVHLPKHRFTPTCWINGATGPDPRQLLNCANGVLDPVTRQLMPHTPNLLTFNRLPYAYDPAATCARFERFLVEVWPTEEDARLVLQEFIGYLLTGDTSHEKILCLIGAKRSGKGTINHTIRAVVGEENVTSPKLQSFGETFGRQSLIGKRVAILADVRIGPRTDVSSAASTLLEISGRDPQTIARKFLGAWEGHLETRLVLMSNLPLSITDGGGVLPSRYLTLGMRQTFAGREDPNLKATLTAEAPGILNWSLAGLERLRSNGKFTTLESSKDLQRQTENLASGLGMFIDECLEFGPSDTHFIIKDDLYGAYLAWFSRQGYPDSLRLSKEMFGSQFVGHTIDRGVSEVQRRGADPAKPDARPWGWKCVRRRDGATVPDYGPDGRGAF